MAKLQEGRLLTVFLDSDCRRDNAEPVPRLAQPTSEETVGLTLAERRPWGLREVLMRGALSATSRRIDVAQRARLRCVERAGSPTRDDAPFEKFTASVCAAAERLGASVTNATAGFVTCTRRTTAGAARRTKSPRARSHHRSLGWETGDNGTTISFLVIDQGETCSWPGLDSRHGRLTRG